MLEQAGPELEDKVLDEYLGFRIHGEASGPVCALPKFAGRGARALYAANVPLLRKRIWQWWNCLEVAGN